MYHHHFTPRTSRGIFEVFMAVILKMTVSRDMMPCSVISPDEGGNGIL
jgi:hypothetical protein